MKILITNDDSLTFQGIHSLVEILKPFGELLVVAPKYHQSGMSMAVSMGLKPIAAKKLKEEPGVEWWYVDGTPATCVKFAIDIILKGELPDVVVSGINHGFNCASAELYSGTLGAVREAALAGVTGIGVSLGSMSPKADFSVVEKMFPDIFRKILETRSDKFGVFYNVNFPNLPEDQILGVRMARLGLEHWADEFQPFDYDIFKKFGILPRDLGILSFPEVEDGETVYVMAGTMTGDERNTADTDSLLLREGYVTIAVQNLDSTDKEETARLKEFWQ